MDGKGNLQVPRPEKDTKSVSTSPIKTPVTQFKQSMKLPTGSATGNPRNKTALKPGHSLMDWIRLGNSGIDLAGTGGIHRPVSSIELARHNKPEDVWMAVRGKVYNVTNYLDFHPGGVDELMRGAGKDATRLFDEVHAWVNYEALLAKCFIGPLRNVGVLHLGDGPTPQPDGGSLSPPSASFLKPPSPVSLPGATLREVIDPVSTRNNQSAISIVSSSSDESASNLVSLVPRFDWIQKTAEVTFIFYIKALHNPAVIVEYIDPAKIDVRFYLEGNVLYRYLIQPTGELQWPCTLRQSLETGKVEIVFNKTVPELWKSHGQMECDRKENYQMELNEYDVATRIEITHDSCALLLRPRNNNLLQLIPIGHHVTVTGSVAGEFVTRSYTPVPANAVPTECPQTFVPLLVKTYPQGSLSRYLTRPVPLASSLQLSQPSGNFSLAKLKHHNRIALLAAGSGVTPMFALLNYLLDRSSNKLESISLLYFNKSEADIWCRELLHNLATKDKRLTVRHFLSDVEPPSSASSAAPSVVVSATDIETSAPDGGPSSRPSTAGSFAPLRISARLLERGRISLDIAQRLTNVDSPLHATYVCLCGPKPFNELCCQFLEQAGHNMTYLHSFQG